MSPEQYVALLGAITALLVAIGAVIRELHTTRQLLDGKLSELLTSAQQSALKEGELRGRDWVAPVGKSPTQEQ